MPKHCSLPVVEDFYLTSLTSLRKLLCDNRVNETSHIYCSQSQKQDSGLIKISIVRRCTYSSEYVSDLVNSVNSVFRLLFLMAIINKNKRLVVVIFTGYFILRFDFQEQNIAFISHTNCLWHIFKNDCFLPSKNYKYIFKNNFIVFDRRKRWINLFKAFKSIRNLTIENRSIETINFLLFFFWWVF